MGNIQEYKRHTQEMQVRRVLITSARIGILALVLTLGSVLNRVWGLRIVQVSVDPATLSSRSLFELPTDELAVILVEHLPGSQPLVLIRDQLLQGTDTPDFSTRMIGDLLAGKKYPTSAENKTVRQLTTDEVTLILAQNLSQKQLFDLVQLHIVGYEILGSWGFIESFFNRSGIEQELQKNYPEAKLESASWLTPAFLQNTMSTTAAQAGVKTAITGSLWVTVLAVLIAFPIGVGAAIYTEEYAKSGILKWLVNNGTVFLVGFPAILYGLFGYIFFARVLVAITGGRTIFSAALTIAVMMVSIIVINTQSAIKAVHEKHRLEAYNLGVKKWRVIRYIILPEALPGILTGLILAVSRGIGETAPLLIVGAATFLTEEPTGLFSKFTALPIQIYDWAKRPDPLFVYAAAAAIVVLLVLVLGLNGGAIYLRGRYQTVQS